MKARALKDFKGRYGMIRTGMIFECEPSYFKALAQNRMVEAVKDQTTPAMQPTPPLNRNIPEAPRTAGKETPDGQGKPPGDTAPPPAAGPGITSRSLRQDLRSRRKTSERSAAGEPKTPEKDPPAAS